MNDLKNIIEDFSFLIKNIVLPLLIIIVIFLTFMFIFKRDWIMKLFSIQPENKDGVNKGIDLSKGLKFEEVSKDIGLSKVLEFDEVDLNKVGTYIEGGSTPTGSSDDSQGISNDLNNINKYYEQSLIQSKISFWYSLIFAGLGFLIIISSVFIYDKKVNYPGVIAGIVTDAVAALVFYQSNIARKQMAEYFDKLRKDLKIRESIKMCQRVQDQEKRDELMVKLSLYFAGVPNREK